MITLTANDLDGKVREFVGKIEKSDSQLADELQQIRNAEKFKRQAGQLVPRLKSVFTESAGGLEGIQTTPALKNSALETIVLRVGRPVLSVYEGETILNFKEAESEVWRNKLIAAQEQLNIAIQAVGRIEVENHPVGYTWLGTGWLVEKDIVVTNRHVAELFGRSNGNGFVFRQGTDGNSIRASIDFLEEADNPRDFTFRLKRILHIAESHAPDVAFLQVEPVDGKEMPSPITLSTRHIDGNPDVAVIGYPARDSRIPDQQLMIDIFGDVFDKKRLAPGQVISVGKTLLHDCSTLGGNSGSVVFDLSSGEALGLHFAGRFLEANFAVPASIVKQNLQLATKNRRPSYTPDTLQTKRGSENKVTPSNNKHSISFISTDNLKHNQRSLASTTFTIPLQVTISFGESLNGKEIYNLNDDTSIAVDGEDVNLDIEARPEDYLDRKGYNVNFIGEDYIVSLPEVVDPRRKHDLLTFSTSDGAEYELKYQHFSVVMSRTRRICLFSAVNIDGKSSRGMKRVGWKLDPRIPRETQIIKECYGAPPKFSRGHMTRREDPIWGSDEEAMKGNADSMHVTNAVPQMQIHNGGVWLELENYALHNARADDMRISVFTGPILEDSDPITKYSEGVKVPLSFWKVIAFVHDDTNELCATGYIMSQKEYLSEDEFIFGKHKTAQVPITLIEQRTGLSFGELTEVDPLNTQLEVPELYLTNVNQIRFR
ncbi:DNA/RNA non-specific endonuclease [Pontibacter vulgaris]|uniref:DNA/RNA non-specific endonuclease n=1 Tax=Pontibacter vulgaris TaxID=2905679 RepID=UPI001FA6ABF1|nr:DNA/RNA non-specific endonuclease [Pontibacter vulgaris]